MTTHVKRTGRPPLDLSKLSGGHPLAQPVRDEMIARGMTIVDVTRLVGTQSGYLTVYMFVTGRSAVSDQAARRVADAVGVPTPPPKPAGLRHVHLNLSVEDPRGDLDRRAGG